MTNQRGGTYDTTTAADLKAYDRLPRSFRDLLKETLHNYAAQAVKEDMIDFLGAGTALIALTQANAQDFANERADRQLARGAWKGNVPLVAESRRK